MRNPRNVHTTLSAGEADVRLSAADIASILGADRNVRAGAAFVGVTRLLSNEGEVALRLALRRAADAATVGGA